MRLGARMGKTAQKKQQVNNELASPARASTSKMAPDRLHLRAASEPASSAEMSQLIALMQGVAADIATIRADILDIRGSLDSLAHWVSAAEPKLGKLDSAAEDHEVHINRLEEDLVHQAHFARKLWDRVQDLENRSRRNNIRVLGVPEGAEGNGVSGPALLLTILRECLPLNAADSIKVEHAHHTLGPRPPADQRLRPIIARLLQFQVREHILRLARESGELRWCGGRIMIFPDMSRELVTQRKLFTPA
nr:PREDICTED: uncharacterized protein LOC106706118 [Latimeria chalumnae]|eukprot:XP_014352056.1 PREDICTED: uncharacterized protein LOC106706118 [Latimeria chalumnae]